MADTTPAQPAPVEEKKKPQKPDEAQFKKDVEKAEKEYQASMAKYVSCAASC